MPRTVFLLALLTAAISASAQSDGKTGLLGQYFRNLTLAGPPALKRVDAQVNFDWAEAPAAGFPGDQFSVRWTGQVKAEQSGTHTFITETDDGVRLWVNGQKLVDQWVDQGATGHQGEIKLEGGRSYDLVMEYYENSGFAVARLSWSVAGAEKKIIPSSALTPKIIVDKSQKR